ncbi:MAG: HAMP domain-containing histidine kinase, partial [Clostridia bacterium]|nr:HAMP domain-containing histidine kinase [Clostridia bacterium]
MSELSERIDSLISGAEDVDIRCYSEGELSILQSELTKLTVKLREQTSALRDDKKLLADSIADISHQIRTPLTAINLLLTEYSKSVDEAERANLLSDLNRQLARIDRLISALLKLARLDADSVTMETSEVPLKELIREALSPIDIQMELRDQEAVIEAEGTVICDRSWTAEALTNILKNCSEHMGAGRLYITASDTPLFSEIVIRDTGKGIDAYDLPHIFERFYKGKNSAPSSVGIGLALSRAIIIKQNGTVKAENAREGGAVFTIRFYKGAV